MVHRDVKPGNLIVTPDGQVKVLDFGLSRFVSESLRNEGLTPSNAVVGTPDYLAPEQADDPRVADIRADIYSLGCTLYHLLAGQPPFPHGTIIQRLVAHRERSPRPLDAFVVGLPPGLSEIVSRMMEKRPEARFPTPAAVADALRPFCHAGAVAPPTPGRQRRSRLLAGALSVAGAVLALGSVIVFSSAPPGPSPVATSEKTAIVQGPDHSTRPSPPTPSEPAVATAPLPTSPMTSVRPVPSGPMTNAALPKVNIQIAMPRFHQKGVTELSRREAIIAWYRNQCPSGAESTAADQWAERLLKTTDTQHDLHLILGPGIVRSRKVSFVSSFGDGLFVFELPPSEIAPLYITENHVKANVKAHSEPRKEGFECSDLTLINTTSGKEGIDITLGTRYVRRQPIEGPLAMRVYEYSFDQKDILRYVPLGPLTAEEGSFQFKFPWAAPLQTRERTPPIPIFFELCTTAEPGVYKT